MNIISLTKHHTALITAISKVSCCDDERKCSQSCLAPTDWHNDVVITGHYGLDMQLDGIRHAKFFHSSTK